MCVAVVIETNSGVSDDDVRKMASANPHGGGVAWVDGNAVHFRKGLDADDVIKMLPHLPRPFFMHFRIATRGGQKPELTHPFPVGYDALVRADELTGLAPAVVMHNGTWSEYRKFIPIGVKENDVSDTQIAAYVAGFDESILDHVGWSNAIMRAVGNGRADITFRGQWYDLDGNHFSNMHWRTERIGRTSYGKGEYFSFDDWMDWRSGRGVVGGREVIAPKGRDFTKAPDTSKSERVAKAERREAKKARRAARLAAKRAAVAEAADSRDAIVEIDIMDRLVEAVDDDEGVIDLVDLLDATATGADVREADTREFLDRDWDAIDATIRRQGIKI